MVSAYTACIVLFIENYEKIHIDHSSFNFTIKSTLINYRSTVLMSRNSSQLTAVNPNVAKIPHRRVGCAHQISLISFVKGGHSPPYTNYVFNGNFGINNSKFLLVLFEKAKSYL
jgi:hypothetical protein